MDVASKIVGDSKSCCGTVIAQGAAVAVETVDASMWSTNGTVNASEAAKTGISPSQDSNLEPRTSELANSPTRPRGCASLRDAFHCN